MYTPLAAFRRGLRAVSIRFTRCRLAAAGFSAALAWCLPAPATPIVGFDFDDGSGGFVNSAALLASGFTASAWADSDGTLTDFSGNPGRALAAKSWHDGNALWFTLFSPPGTSWNFEGFSFDQRASSTGPLAWTLKLGGMTAGGGATTQSFSTAAGPGAVTGLSGAVLVELAADGAPSSTGTWRIDNFRLDGSIVQVPEPGTWLMLLTGLLVLYAWRSLPGGRLNCARRS